MWDEIGVRLESLIRMVFAEAGDIPLTVAATAGR